MVKAPPNPEVPNDLRHAFWGAIGAFSNWRPGQPEPEVSYQQRPTSISIICSLIEQYEEQMPGDLWRLLISQTRRSAEPPLDQSFSSGGKFLQEEIADKRRRFNLMDRSP